LKKNLTLTGMMGVGKTTIGKILSELLSMQFIDIDKIIEKKHNMTISKIFELRGENYFRRIEEYNTLEQAKKKNVIISLGGGAFMNSNIREEILLNSESFWLNTNLEIIKERVKKSQKRPLLNNDNFKKTLEQIYHERKDFYALADHKIECNKQKPKLIAKIIIKIYENR